MATIETRLIALEQKVTKLLIVTRIICKGAKPNDDEQARIDDAEKMGHLVIIRLIV
jgi:GTP cyclohydrolase II